MDLMRSKGRYDIDARVRDFEATRGLLLEQYRLKTDASSGHHRRGPADAPAALVDAGRHACSAWCSRSSTTSSARRRYEKLGEEGEDIRMQAEFRPAHALGGEGAERERRSGAFSKARRRMGCAAQQLIDDTDSVNRCIDYGEDLMRKAWEPMSIMPPSDAKIVMRSVPQWLLRQRRSGFELRRGI
jgi:hypothetical protein